MKNCETEKLTIVDALELRVAAGRGVTPDEYAILRNSACARTLRIFVDGLHRPGGYVAWANINRASLDRLVRTGRLPKYHYEWTEGGICLILDVLILSQARYDIIRQLRKFALTKRVIVSFRARKAVRLYVRSKPGFHRRRDLSSVGRASAEQGGNHLPVPRYPLKRG